MIGVAKRANCSPTIMLGFPNVSASFTASGFLDKTELIDNTVLKTAFSIAKFCPTKPIKGVKFTLLLPLFWPIYNLFYGVFLMMINGT